MVKRNQPRYPRTARLNELIREIVAEELTRLDDDRIGFLAVTSVSTDPGIDHAVVYFDTFAGAEADALVLEALEEHRWKIQAAIGRQTRLKNTPQLVFRPDEVERRAERVEGILRDLDVEE